MPKFSIIIPVHNRTAFLKEAVQSCLDQTLQDFEIIIVDDGSLDSVAKELDHLSEQSSLIKVFHQKNKGVSMARNRGIDAAEGDYLIFLDDDDTLAPEMLQKAKDYFMTSVQTDIVVCKGDSISSTDHFNERFFLRKLQVSDANKHLPWLNTSKKTMFFLLYYPLVNAFIYKKEVLANYRFSPVLPVSAGEDTFLWLELSKQNLNFGVMDWCGAYYRLHGFESTTSVQTIKQQLLFWSEVEKLAATKKEKLFVRKAIAGYRYRNKEISLFRYLLIVLKSPLFYLSVLSVSLRRRWIAKVHFLRYRYNPFG